MPTTLRSQHVLDLGVHRAMGESDDETFDRVAFARQALDLVQPPCMTVAICEGAARMRVESGRAWGRGDGGSTWALLVIPHRASKRAIALAVAQLARDPHAYALDLLLGEYAPT